MENKYQDKKDSEQSEPKLTYIPKDGGMILEVVQRPKKPEVLNCWGDYTPDDL